MRSYLCLALLFCSFAVFAENYLLNGGQTSEIDYTMDQEIIPEPGISKLSLSYVKPVTFISPSYKQTITQFKVAFSREPDMRDEYLDKRGNRILKVSWFSPQQTIKAQLTIKARNRTDLQSLSTRAPFPIRTLPQKTWQYLESSQQAPKDDPAIAQMARDLTRECETQFDAVQQILTWVVDHVTYVLRPKSYDATYSMRTGKGNCQNFSHVAAALMRAVNIPVRIVNGVTLGEPYLVQLQGGCFNMNMAQGRHSWIEVFFTDLGWVPFDPQQMQLFVSNRFIRVEVGLDNKEAVADGSVRWSRHRGSRARPRYREAIHAEFLSDHTDLFAQRQNYGPRRVLFTPHVKSAFSRIPYEASATAPVMTRNINLKTLDFSEDFLQGNLDFPAGVNFMEFQSEPEAENDTTLVLFRNFMVETSEYVTTQGKKYAQTFILDDPVELSRIGLALHCFGGQGKLWVELLTDDGDGRPGDVIAASEFITTGSMPQKPGYDWVDFSFDPKKVRLAPGRFWAALCYTESPVVNWFYTYGKPVGPADGTRFNTLFDENWSHSLTHEFNYRIVGLKGK